MFMRNSAETEKSNQNICILYRLDLRNKLKRNCFMVFIICLHHDVYWKITHENTNAKYPCKEIRSEKYPWPFIYFVLSATANPNVAYIDQTQQSTMATPSNISSPGVYPMASYPPPQRDASLWTDDNKLLGPRPSYVALTKYSTSHVNTQIKRSIRV